MEAMQEFIGLCLDPEGDSTGKERAEALQAALDQLGCATRALESAEGELDNMDVAEVEPWEEES